MSCIRTALGCLSPAQYREERRAIEDGHAGEDGFRNQWGLSAVRADRAWAQLELEHGGGTAPGGGVTVGVFDSGIDAGHPAFAGKTVSEEFLDGAPDETGDRVSHGTAVAGVIAARPDASFTGAVDAAPGVAWGADLAVFALRTRESGGVYVPVSLSGLGGGDDDPWASRVRRVTDWRRGGRTVDFVNVSVGFHGIIDQYGERQLRDGLGGVIDALAQPGAADKTVFVWAAGNAHGDLCEAADFSADPDLCVEAVEGGETVRRVDARSVEILPGLPARISELRGHLIAVVAVAPDGDGDGDYEIAPFSNRCGIAREWCLAAPGAAVRVAYFGPPPRRRESGRPGRHDVERHVLRRADGDRRARRDEAVLPRPALEHGPGRAAPGDGRQAGRLRRRRHLRPGPDGPRRGDGAGGRRPDRERRTGGPLRRRRGRDEPRFGPGPRRRAGAGPGRTGDRRLRRPGGAVLVLRSAISPAPRPAPPWPCGFGPSWRLRRRIGQPGPDGLRIGLLEEPSADAGGGHLSLAGRALAVRAAAAGGLGLAVFSNEGLRGRSPASGAVLSWGPSGAPLGLRGGLVAERETLLGSRAAGAFGRLSAGSAFAGVDGSARIGAWRLAAGAEVGMARRGRGRRDPRRPLAAVQQRLRPPGGAADGRRGVAAALGVPAAARRGRPRPALGPGRPHQGRPGAAPAADGRSRPLGPPGRGRGPLAPPSRGRRRAPPRRELDPAAGPRGVGGCRRLPVRRLAPRLLRPRSPSRRRGIAKKPALRALAPLAVFAVTSFRQLHLADGLDLEKRVEPPQLRGGRRAQLSYS